MRDTTIGEGEERSRTLSEGTFDRKRL